MSGEIKNKEEIEIGRHTLAHVLAKAVTELYDNVKLAIGPYIDNGFYYDLDMPHVLTENDFEQIQKKMAEIISRKEDLRREEITVQEAKKMFADQKYKLELIEDLEKKSEDMSVYYLGDDFVDLCRGPHVSNTSELKKLGIQDFFSSGCVLAWRREKLDVAARVCLCFPKQT